MYGFCFLLLKIKLFMKISKISDFIFIHTYFSARKKNYFNKNKIIIIIFLYYYKFIRSNLFISSYFFPILKKNYHNFAFDYLIFD